MRADMMPAATCALQEAAAVSRMDGSASEERGGDAEKAAAHELTSTVLALRAGDVRAPCNHSALATGFDRNPQIVCAARDRYGAWTVS